MNRLICLASAVPLSFLLACAGVADEDGDLLSDNLELLIGTNVEIADSDGDGFTDAEEWLAYFNPMDGEDHPWEGEYYRMPSPLNHPSTDQEIDASGVDEGDISDNWQLTDRYGDLVDLHDFYGQVILIDMGAEWCGPCRLAAPAAQAEFEDLRGDGFVVLNLLTGGLNGGPADAGRWSDQLGLTFPVLPDDNQAVSTNYVVVDENNQFSIPNFSVLGRDMTIERIYVAPSPTALIDDLMDDDAPSVYWPLPENTEDLRAELGIEVLHNDVHLQANVDLGIELAGAGASSSGGGGDSGASDSGFTVSNNDGSYAGPPWGGTACNASGDASGNLVALLLGLLGLAGIRRR